MRKRYEMNKAQHDSILEASKPTPVMFLSGGQPMFDTPQENANRAWRSLADEMGFIWDTVQPTGEGERIFTAEEK